MSGVTKDNFSRWKKSGMVEICRLISFCFPKDYSSIGELKNANPNEGITQERCVTDLVEVRIQKHRRVDKVRDAVHP